MKHILTSRRILRSMIVAVVIVTLTPQAASTQYIVFDPRNFAENVLSAARALEQINNQIRSLENQARNLTGLPTSIAAELKSHVEEFNRLLGEAQGITFDVERTVSEFERLYPREYTAAVSADRMVQHARARWANSHEALKQTLQTQSKIVEAISRDGAALETLLSASSGAIGALQAQQSGNELAGLQVKQSLQMQALVAAQSRADAVRDAERRATEEAARERFTRFIGDGRAYAGGR